MLTSIADLLPLSAAAVVALAVGAFALYVWTWARYVASPDTGARARDGRRPCGGEPIIA